MKLRILILAFAALVLAIPAQAQSLRYLAYDTTNWTVLGWTNTNALTFTNPIAVGDTQVDAQGISWSGARVLDGESLELVSGTNGVVMQFGSGNVIFTVPVGFGTNVATTQANLFATNTAPSNTTNVVRWISITVSVSGTNQTFRIPLYQ